MSQYEIFEGNMERLRKKLTRIQNKCNKYGCEFKFEEVGETYREIKDDNGEKRVVRFVVVEAEGKAIINDWKFIGTVEHTSNGNIIRTCCDIEVPERYYTGDIVCEHCKQNRARKEAYIVLNVKTGEFKEVGSGCLNDFTHGMDADLVAKYMSFFDDLIAGDCPIGCGWGERYYSVDELLRYTSECVRVYGYEKSDCYDGGTKGRVVDFWMAIHGYISGKALDQIKREMERISFDADSELAKAEAVEALKWIDSQEENNNYMHNLKTICKQDYIKYANIGILVSIFPTWRKDIEIKDRKRIAMEKAKQEADVSEWHGNIGDRVEFGVKEFAPITGWDTQFGYVTVYKIVDKDGNVFTWKTSKLVQSEDVHNIKGTIKEFRTYNGVKQTELTRCKTA